MILEYIEAHPEVHSQVRKSSLHSSPILTPPPTGGVAVFAYNSET